MILLKKLFFAPLFLITFILLVAQLNPILKSYDLIFSLSTSTLIQLVIVIVLIFLSSFLFILFATIASDWKISLLIGVAASAIPLILMERPLGFVFSIGILISMLLVIFTLDMALKSYLNFQPASLLGPVIRRLSTYLILAFCVIYFLSTNQNIAQKGFEIPDSLIDTALKMAPMNTSAGQGLPAPSLPTISPEQIEILKQNPDLLRQSGLDPKILDSLDNPSKLTQEITPALDQNFIKQTVKDQTQSLIKPYLSFVPAGLAVLLFLTLQSLTSIANLLTYPLLWGIFALLEGTGFIKFETEMREVKKMVV